MRRFCRDGLVASCRRRSIPDLADAYPHAGRRSVGPDVGPSLRRDGIAVFEGWAKDLETGKSASAFAFTQSHSSVGPITVPQSQPLWCREQGSEPLHPRSTRLGNVAFAQRSEVLDRPALIRETLCSACRAIPSPLASAQPLIARGLTLATICISERRLLGRSRALAPFGAPRGTASCRVPRLHGRTTFLLNVGMAMGKASQTRRRHHGVVMVTACAATPDSASGLGRATVFHRAVDSGRHHFPGFSYKGCNPTWRLRDRETYRLGAFAMAAAPAVVG